MTRLTHSPSKGWLLAVLTIGAVAAVFGLLWLWAAPDAPADHPNRADLGRSDTPRAAQEPAVPASAPAPPVPFGDALASRASAPRDSAAPALSQLRATTRNERVFVEAAKRRPHEGGVFHALGAMEHCRTQRAVAQSLDLASISPERRLAAEELLRRCADFTDAELGWSEIKVLEELGREKDPFLALNGRALAQIRAGLTEPNRLSLIQAVLDSGDGYVWDALLPHVAAYLETAPPLISYYFAGRRDGGLSTDSFTWALAVASCRVANHCGGDAAHRAALVACVLDRLCGSDYASAMQRAVPAGDDPKAFAALVDALAVALATRNARAFVK